ncbi:hypothetical protein CTA2_7990 [Colletotrichum tanaceti]|uniref:Uncharacterized protein n=1 Tax=Colletotrichum tanaceti TaxID=1306861 RepID=A0A4U6XGQ7_9PEZI|nr:hypothetical protein CTA2_7990 [Colletotrichum tanaceti]TKW54579.1 hypothetical protein CTA1_8987 [Colletotrichum tanaceti]
MKELLLLLLLLTLTRPSTSRPPTSPSAASSSTSWPTRPAAATPPALVRRRAGLDDADYHTTCKTLTACLGVVKAWSDAHRDHVPIPFMIEFKTSDAAIAAGGDGDGDGDRGAAPILWNDTALLRRPRRRDPRRLRPGPPRHPGRPPPREPDAREGVLSLMDNGPVHPVRDAYADGHPNLEGHVLLHQLGAGQPRLRVPKGEGGRERERERERERAPNRPPSAPGSPRATGSAPAPTCPSTRCCPPTTRRPCARPPWRAAPQVVSTDFQAYGMSARWDADYAVRFGGGAAALEPVEYIRNQGG